jgi:hypothetical protein
MATKFWHSCCDHVTVDGNSSVSPPHELGLGGSPDKDGDERQPLSFSPDTELYGLGPDVDCTKNFKVDADAQSL